MFVDSLVYCAFSYCDSQVLEQSRKWPRAGAGICVGATHQE